MYLYEIYVVIYHSNERENGKSQKSVSIADCRSKNTKHIFASFSFNIWFSNSKEESKIHQTKHTHQSQDDQEWISEVFSLILFSLMLSPDFFIHLLLFSGFLTNSFSTQSFVFKQPEYWSRLTCVDQWEVGRHHPCHLLKHHFFPLLLLILKCCIK